MGTDFDGFICYWRIENFLLRRPKNDLLLESPSFYAGILNSSWRLQLEQTRSGFIGLYLYKESNFTVFRVKTLFCVLKSGGWTSYDHTDWFTNRFKAGGDGYGVDDLISWNDISNDEWTWLPHGALTVYVHMKTSKTENEWESAQCLLVSRMVHGCSEMKDLPVQYFNNLKQTAFLKFPCICSPERTDVRKDDKSVSTQEMKTETTQTEEISPFKDREDLHRFFKEKDFDFVTLRTIKKDFTVHKAVLCAKSPVFNAMFERRMLENDSSLVDIQDVNGDTLAMLLRYLHFEPLKDLHWEDAMNLYYAADKYQIEGLKDICLIFLKKELSLETVCEAFVMADLHQDVNFMQNAFEFFCENSKFILKSEEWKKLLRNKPDLASEVLEKLADKM